MADDGGVGDARGGGAHQDLDLGVVLLHHLGEGVFHVEAGRHIREDEAVVGIDGALDAARPGEGLVRAEEDGPDPQKVSCDLLFSVHPRNSFTHLS